MNAELEARRTAAAAVAADFTRETGAYLDADGPRPDFDAWAWRLHSELRLVLDRLGDEPGPLGQLPPDVSGDLDAIPANRIGGPVPLELLGAEAAARHLAQVRLVLDSFDWETDDSHYALEQVDDILNGRDR